LADNISSKETFLVIAYTVDATAIKSALYPT